VEFADNNLVMTPLALQVEPRDFLYVDQRRYLTHLRLQDAWDEIHKSSLFMPGASYYKNDTGFGSPNIVIGIMDWGIQSFTENGITEATHPEFRGKVSNGKKKICQFFDFDRMKPDNDSVDNSAKYEDHHGSKVAGIASALANNVSSKLDEFEGISGVAPNCRIMSLRMPSAKRPEMAYYDAMAWTGGLDPGWVEDGINYGAKRQEETFPKANSEVPDVIVNSYEYPEIHSEIFNIVVSKLLNRGRKKNGTILIFAAGNDEHEEGKEVHHLNPAALVPGVIVVSATTIDDWNGEVRASYSPYGLQIHVCAPGGDLKHYPKSGIITCTPNGTSEGHTGGDKLYTDRFYGTSAAAPIVGGIVALMLSANPNLKWREVIDILTESADKIDLANGGWQDKDRKFPRDEGYLGPNCSPHYGCGRVNALEAVRAALSKRNFG
jgi:subtilisin family serine protease